jgi:hypothetical protein
MFGQTVIICGISLVWQSGVSAPPHPPISIAELFRMPMGIQGFEGSTASYEPENASSTHPIVLPPPRYQFRSCRKMVWAILRYL